MSEERDRRLARRARVVALVIAASGLAAIAAPWAVAQFGLPLRYEFLIYFAALAGFVWAVAVLYQIWRTGNG